MSSDLHEPHAATHNRSSIVPILVAIAVTFAPLWCQAKCNQEEVGYIAIFDVKPGSEEAFEKAITDLANTITRVEEGTIFYAPYRGDDGKYRMLERYRDEAARKVHATSGEVRAKFGPLMATLAKGPEIQGIAAVCATN